MTMAEPDPNDPDETFMQMMSQLADIDIDPTSITVTPVDVLDDLSLMQHFEDCKKELRDREEMLNAKTDTGRDLQSRYHAYLLEMKKRGLL